MKPEEAGRRRRWMVDSQIRARGIRDGRVLAAMETVPRELFVPEESRSMAFEDFPLPIGCGQTISQPYIVACMTEQAAVGPGDRVLEIGTGSGYQTAVLAALAAEVYSIEVIAEHARAAEARLRGLGLANVHLRTGDGKLGWPEEAPFDAILVTAAPAEEPSELLAQLAPGGRMVAPVGYSWGSQYLYRYDRATDGGLKKTGLFAVRFVPLV